MKLATRVLSMIEAAKSVVGKVTKTNYPELELGLIKVGKIDGIGFTVNTEYDGVKPEDLKVGDKVKVVVIDTKQGPFAKELSRK
jgi:uncharacterized OB-fold protein